MGKTARPTYITGGSWLIKTIFQIQIWEFVLTVEATHNLWPKGLLPQVPSPLNLVPVCSVYCCHYHWGHFLQPPLHPKVERTVYLRFTCPWIRMTTIPVHMYTQKVKRTNNSNVALIQFDEWIAVSTSQKQNEPYSKFCWNVETDDATHRPRGFPKIHGRRNTTAHIFN